MKLAFAAAIVALLLFGWVPLFGLVAGALLVYTFWRYPRMRNALIAITVTVQVIGILAFVIVGTTNDRPDHVDVNPPQQVHR